MATPTSRRAPKPAPPPADAAKEQKGEEKNPPPNPEAVLLLFRTNLSLIREWYRLAPGTGVELGHLAMGEIFAANTLSALDLALRGERWQAPV